MIADEGIKVSEISIVIPVKNNQQGINTFLTTFFNIYNSENYPKEIIIVDNNSENALFIPKVYSNKALPISLLQCSNLGPASARNLGAKHAQGKWLLFVDSDCIPTASSLTGYTKRNSLSSATVAFAGGMESLSNDYLSRYYVSQNIHIPPRTKMKDGTYQPQYLVTANTLVLKKAFEQIGGFNESFTLAGGEDIDLALRLKKVGSIGYETNSIFLHNFNDGISGFIKRFVRYGKGNRLIEQFHDKNYFPLPFTAKDKTIITNHMLAVLQWLCLLFGYLVQTIELRSRGIKKNNTISGINQKIR